MNRVQKVHKRFRHRHPKSQTFGAVHKSEIGDKRPARNLSFGAGGIRRISHSQSTVTDGCTFVFMLFCECLSVSKFSESYVVFITDISVDLKYTLKHKFE